MSIGDYSMPSRQRKNLTIQAKNYEGNYRNAKGERLRGC